MSIVVLGSRGEEVAAAMFRCNKMSAYSVRKIHAYLVSW